MPLRLIQIGIGGWGRNWVEEVTRDTPGVEPVAWVDIDPAMRERAVVDLALPEQRVFASLDEVTLADLVAPRILLRQRLGVGGQGDARGLAAIA